MSGLFTLRALLRTLLIALLDCRRRSPAIRFGRSSRKSTRSAARFALDPGPQTTLIYDSKDRVISALYKEHRMPVTLEEMSEPLLPAVLAAEDRRFYEHNGVDRRRICGAMVANLRRGRIVQGASTITQQFVRGACSIARRPTAASSAKRGSPIGSKRSSASRRSCRPI